MAVASVFCSALHQEHPTEAGAGQCQSRAWQQTLDVSLLLGSPALLWMTAENSWDREESQGSTVQVIRASCQKQNPFLLC